MKLSVAMCTYNGAQHLEEQLASLAAQNRLPDEVVICDDASTDTTRPLLERFKTQSGFPVHLQFNIQNLGSWKNFAQAIRLCEGEIIVLCDQDDVWLPEKLARLEAEFAGAPEVGMVFSDLAVFGSKPLGFTAWQCERVEFGMEERDFFNRGQALHVLLTRNVVTGASAAFRRKFVDLVLPFPEFLVHDYWLSLMIAGVAQLVPISTPLVRYRLHSEQQVGLLPPRRYETVRQEAQIKRTHYRLAWERLERVAERLAERTGTEPRYNKALNDLQPFLIHGRVRASLRQCGFLQRLRRATRQLVAGRYHSFRHPNASPWYEFITDVMPFVVGLINRAARDTSIPLAIWHRLRRSSVA